MDRDCEDREEQVNVRNISKIKTSRAGLRGYQPGLKSRKARSWPVWLEEVLGQGQGRGNVRCRGVRLPCTEERLELMTHSQLTQVQAEVSCPLGL